MSFVYINTESCLHIAIFSEISKKKKKADKTKRQTTDQAYQSLVSTLTVELTAERERTKLLVKNCARNVDLFLIWN